MKVPLSQRIKEVRKKQKQKSIDRVEKMKELTEMSELEKDKLELGRLDSSISATKYDLQGIFKNNSAVKDKLQKLLNQRSVLVLEIDRLQKIEDEKEKDESENNNSNG